MSIQRAREFFHLRRRGRYDRFMVLSGEKKGNRDKNSADAEVTDDDFAGPAPNSKYNVFGIWSAAFQFAHSVAKRLGSDTIILDNAKIIKGLGGEYTEATYHISPNGKVHKDFSFWQQILTIF